ncbi:MAG: hypothetical protein HYX41_05455 [Bdellovibrio sp.]|nr:hypothetical protein [Bdellovibrio sp.]
MKIGLVTGIIGYPQGVREKQDGGGAPGHGASKESPNRQKGNESNEPQAEVSDPASDEDVGKAVHDFLTDKQTQANGLSATIDGHGPGLKVVLRDGNGIVVRQLSGQEFLKLRRSVSKEAPVSGKILDQKL